MTVQRTPGLTIGPIDDKVRRLVELHEGRRKRLYKCSEGYVTGGIGHNFDAKGLSDRAIEFIFEEDLYDCVVDLDRLVPWWRGEDEVRRAALIDLMFNLGPERLGKFVNTLGAWRNKVYEAAAIGLENSKWYGQVGDRAKRIVAMVRTGEWPAEIA